MKALLFDFGGTLDADGVAWKDRFHACYRDQGLAMTAAEFAPHFYAADDPLVGNIPETAGLDETAAQLAANIEAGLDRPDPERARRVAACFVADARAALTRSGRALAQLSRRYRLGVVSNFYGNLAAVCRTGGLAGYLQTTIDSQRIGSEKPAPRIFRAALEEIGVRPDEAVFVGDSLHRDRDGARNVGMGFIQVAASPPPVAPDGHPVVSSIAEIGRVLA